ncbi:aldo/keto reductase [Candidatus Marsarchaeota archaeon]|jgi:diketogulonate reductase-like aldo/keto reductase|nr:aldo/keto reductase [Candidatus Marsarchaeota archaeon]
MPNLLYVNSEVPTMETKELGKTGEKIPAIGIGTWKMGAHYNDELSAIRKAIDLGMSFVDTAEMYANEAFVGEAIKGRQVFVATKVSPQHLHYNDVIKACNASLSRLNVKHIDLYQIHWPNSSIPINETMKAMEKLVDDGKIRYIGVSNFSIEELNEAQESMKKYDIVSNQVEYSIMVRNIEDGLIDYCKDEHISVIAYSPLARGAIFDKWNKDLLVFLNDIGARHSKSASQVALNYLISRDNVFAIPKAGSVAHIEENAGAAGWRLSVDEAASIKNFLIAHRMKLQSLHSMGSISPRIVPFAAKLLTFAYALKYGKKRSKKRRT